MASFFWVAKSVILVMSLDLSFDLEEYSIRVAAFYCLRQYLQHPFPLLFYRYPFGELRVQDWPHP